MLTTVPHPTLTAVNRRRPTFWLAVSLLALALATPALAREAKAPATPQPTVSSPVSGITFQDAPRALPVDSHFSQAIQTIAVDVGLSCEQVESYGWSVAPGDQERVNRIFTQTAQELARLGYSVAPQSPGSAAADITVYTATRPDKTVLFTWSAGPSGLLLLTCDARLTGMVDTSKRGFDPSLMTAATAPTEHVDSSTSLTKPHAAA